ncbi:transcriptional adapter 2B isoform X2 [Cylas formicarius]|uniref:transcriptional adapter 2B isoform X2 n=1 Tax=Cylas formicarius TaxID=197179 RepID=UPI0029586194|nr:transcriptional adapter 2B isoform X2 [Cylas formicarius]
MADLFAKVNCTYCQEEISGVRIQCCECPNFDICHLCFASGAEIGPHKNDHSYRFVDNCSVSIFGGRGSWTGREHLQLLDAVELYAYGNWELVAKNVGTRTAEECKEEYISRYLDGNIGRATWAQLANHKLNFVNHVPEDNGPLSQNALSRLPPLDCTPEEAAWLGYKPHRDDYEREYSPSSEQLVAELQLEVEDEGEVEKALKLAIVDIYSRRLRERSRRKRIVRDYQLVRKFFNNSRKDQMKAQVPKQQRELRDKMRVFAQFLSCGEHERLISSMERERELRHRLADLTRYRSLGLLTQQDIIHFEQHAAYQRQQARQKSGSSGSVATRTEQRSVNGSVESDQDFTGEKSTSDPSGGCASSSSNDSSSFSNNSNCSSSQEAAVPAPDLAKLPMGSLLSRNEIQLCTDLNLVPMAYVTMKSLIIMAFCRITCCRQESTPQRRMIPTTRGQRTLPSKRVILNPTAKKRTFSSK